MPAPGLTQAILHPNTRPDTPSLFTLAPATEAREAAAAAAFGFSGTAPTAAERTRGDRAARGHGARARAVGRPARALRGRAVASSTTRAASARRTRDARRRACAPATRCPPARAPTPTRTSPS